MRVLFTLYKFRDLTGSELYFYEIGRELRKRGIEAHIVSDCGGEIKKRAEDAGIYCYDFKDLGKFKYDVLHLSHAEPTQRVLAVYNQPAIVTIHSEFALEHPLIHPQIKKYICIRPEIQEKYKRLPTRVVYNGIDLKRFKPPLNNFSHGNVLFVGTIDSLRKNAQLHLVNESIKRGFDVLFIGEKHSSHLDNLHLSNIAIIPPVWGVERHVQRCDETAGVLLGRTTIEGWACGKPGWIYDIDEQGEIRSVSVHKPPDMKQFDISNVTDILISEYKAITKTTPP